jgi:hypothetical protein
MTGALPVGDGDYYKVTLAEGAIVRASTYVGSVGQCPTGDTVLSLWKMPVASSSVEAGSCSTSAVGAALCNDNDPDNGSCSKLEYTVPTGQAGDYAIKVHNYSTTQAIPAYGVVVNVVGP